MQSLHYKSRLMQKVVVSTAIFLVFVLIHSPLLGETTTPGASIFDLDPGPDTEEIWSSLQLGIDGFQTKVRFPRVTAVNLRETARTHQVAGCSALLDRSSQEHCCRRQSQQALCTFRGERRCDVGSSLRTRSIAHSNPLK